MRVVGRVIGLITAAVALLWPLIGQAFSGGGQPVDDPVTITKYAGDFVLAADGQLQVTETVTAQFPAGRHGIFRYWDLADPSDPGVRHQPRELTVTRDGQPEPFSTSQESFGRFFVAKVGQAEVYLQAGSHTYVISYKLRDAIAPPTAGTGSFVSQAGSNDGAPGSAFYWNVIAQGWEMSIAAAEISLRLPQPAGQVRCSAGTAGGAPGPCEISGAGTRTVTLSARNIPPRTGMTVRVALPAAAPARGGLPWSVRWDPILGSSVPLALGLLSLSVLALLAGLRWASQAQEPEPGFPVMYEPPAGLGPVQTVYLAEESVGRHALTASILHLAERGFVTLQRGGEKDWTITGRTNEQYWDQLDQVSRLVGRELGVTQPHQPFAADGKADSGKVLQSVATKLGAQTKKWAEEAGFVESSGREQLGKALVVVAAAFMVLGSLNLLGPTLLGLPFAMFAVGGVTMLGVGVGQRRTTAGREQWARAGGFYRLLSTPSAQDRFDFSGRKDLFISYIPYAVAFGVADKWAQKYRAATGEEPPVPVWYPYYGTHAFYSQEHSFDSFDTALASSISAYTASQSHSGGGGGGFGGGGGGGGGGSW